RIHGTGEREVLPDEDAEFIAEVVEVLGLVYAAAPDTEHVEPRLFRQRQTLPQLLARNGGGKGVVGNPVRALGKRVYALDAELEAFALAVSVPFTDEFDAPETYFRVNFLNIEYLDNLIIILFLFIEANKQVMKVARKVTRRGISNIRPKPRPYLILIFI